MRRIEPAAPLAELCGLLDGREEAPRSRPESALLALARRHRVEPLLHVRLAGATDALARDYRENAERVLRSLAWLRQLTQALAADGIEARPLKGLPLADQAYGRIADRYCGDLDLLIDSNRLRERADLVVRGLGLRPRLEMAAAPLRLHRALHKDDGYLSPDGLRVELHYRRDGIGRHVFPDFMAFGSRAWQTCRVESVATQRLYGTPLLVYLLSHGTRSRWHRLKWLLDIRRLTHDFDADAWTGLRHAAREENMESQVHIGLELLARTFGAPSGAAPRPGSGFALRECMTDLNGEAEPPDSAWRVARRILYGLLVQKNWRARLAVAGGSLLRDADIARWKLPLPLILVLAPLARPFSLVYRRALRPAARWLWR